MPREEAGSGMSLAELAQAYPEAIANSSPDHLHDGSTGDVVIPHLEIAAHDFRVEFYFRDGRLVQVMIVSDGGPELEDFRAVASALRAKYGPEMEYEESDYGFSEASWFTEGQINIALVCYPAADCLNIVFQTRLAAEASKL